MYKKLHISTIILITAVIISGCSNETPRYPDPSACFVVQKDTVYVNEPVYFNNCSDNADSYDWEFGDGIVSVEKHPTHSYSKPGNYQVRLTAYGYGSYDSQSKIITVLGVTELDILVNYYGTDDPVSNCPVTLYESNEDWQNFENPLITDTTGTSGIVLFSDLEPQIYYMDAFKAVTDTSYYSNELLGYTTETLIENETNYYTIEVELLYSNNKSDRKEYIIREVKKRKPPIQ
jgi:PKD repeat protein